MTAHRAAVPRMRNVSGSPPVVAVDALRTKTLRAVNWAPEEIDGAAKENR